MDPTAYHRMRVLAIDSIAFWTAPALRVACGVLIVGSIGLLAADGIAGPPENRPCCAPHGFRGCEEPNCEMHVCKVDPYCCDVLWDNACVMLARDHCSGMCEVWDGPFDLALRVLPGEGAATPGAFSASGVRLAVGFPDVAGPSGPQQGRVAIFLLEDNGHVSLESTLTSPDGLANDRFGFAVSLRNDSLLVGAPFHDPNGLLDAGAAYCFERQANGTWSFIRKYAPEDLSSGDRFGHAVGAVREEGVEFVFGAPGRDLWVGPDAGVFYYTDWSTMMMRTTPNPAAGDQFGYAIATRAHPLGYGPGTFAVTAPFSNHPYPDAGAVHTYFGGGSFYLGAYYGPSLNSRMGTTISGTYAINIVYGGLTFGGFAAGCPNASVNGIAGRGRVEVFAPPSFAIASLFSDSNAAYERFGSSVSWWGNRLLIQAQGPDDRGSLSTFRSNLLSSSGRVPFILEATFRNPDRFQVSAPVVLHEDRVFFNAGPGWGASRLDLFPLLCGPAGEPSIDSDGDGVADCTDLDDDQDGTADPADGCPQDAWKVHPGCQGCGVPEPDADADRIPDCVDNCATVANVTQGDCDGNGFGDACTIADGLDTDFDGNGVPDACDCLPDLDRSGGIDAIDLAMMIAAYGSTTPGPADINRDGFADGNDLARMLAAWGDCP